MHLFSLKLPVIRKKDPLIDIIIQELKADNKKIKEGDIVVISEKVVATSQGRIINLNEIMDISEKAKNLATKYNMDPRYVQVILNESSSILGGMHHVILAKMDGLMIANAGIDQSNAGGQDNVVLLPENLTNTVKQYRNRLKNEFNIENLGIIIADSRVQPLRKGTIGVSIASTGFEPVEDLRGDPDLFGRSLEITMRAVADDLTSAAQFLLNEGSQKTPVVVIRNAPVQFTENPLMTTELSPEKCLYMNIFSKYLLKKKERQD